MQPIRTKLTALLGIESPIVVPSMAGAAGSDLAGQVVLAGGYGFVAADLTDAVSFSAELEATRSIFRLPEEAPLPLGAGFLAWILDKEAILVEALRAALEKRVQSVWLSFSPNLGRWVGYIRQYDRDRHESKKHKTLIWILVNSVEEAQKAVNEMKVDVLVVQGSEAGGHGRAGTLPLISLLPLIADTVPQALPLVAAGGIANGTQAAGVLVMGADGIVMGTRFLATPESTYSENQKKAIVEGTTTVRTYLFDQVRGNVGWPDGIDGRAIPNKTLEEAKEGMDAEWMKKYAEGVKDDDTSRRVVWAGSSIGLVKDIKGAKVLLEEIHDEIVAALRKKFELL